MAPERVSENRVARLATLAGIAAQIGYRRRRGRYRGKPVRRRMIWNRRRDFGLEGSGSVG